jgi:hypothetical protein
MILRNDVILGKFRIIEEITENTSVTTNFILMDKAREFSQIVVMIYQKG